MCDRRRYKYEDRYPDPAFLVSDDGKHEAEDGDRYYTESAMREVVKALEAAHRGLIASFEKWAWHNQATCATCKMLTHYKDLLNDPS